MLLSVLLLAPCAAPAKDQAPAEPAFSAAEIDSLVRTIEDPDQRAELVEQLKMLKAAKQAEEPPLVSDGLGAVLLGALSEQMVAITRGFAALGRVVLATPEAVSDLVEEAGDPAIRQRWLEIIVKLVVIIGAALIAAWLTQRLLARPRRAVAAHNGERLWVKILMLVPRGLLEAAPIVAFAAVAYGVLPFTDPRPATRIVALIIVNAIVINRAVRTAADLILAPSAPSLRIPRIDDESAQYGYIWVARLTAVGVYGYFLARAALLLGLPQSAYELLLRVVGLVFAGLVIVIVLQNRTAVAGWLRGRPRAYDMAAALAQERSSSFGSVRRRLADVWHVLAIIYVVATYAIWALQVPGGFEYLLRATVLTAIVLALLRLAVGLVRRAVERGFALSTQMRARFPGLQARANRYLPALNRLLQVALYVLAALWLLEIWGVGAFGWLDSGFGRRLAASAVTIIIIVVLSALALEIVDSLIHRYLAPRDPFGRTVVRSARTRTLLPLLRNAFRVLLAAMVTMIVLSELGINIGPLLAGAGVVGLAIGFGAQTLVKDVITGFFILAEDQVSVGDIVDLGGAAGVVEAMSIRTIRLRDASGSVFLVPFSAVTTIKNMSKEFAFAKIDLRIGYANDVDIIIEAMREIADGMRADEKFRDVILSELEVWGVDKFDETAVTVVTRLKTMPNQQWSVTREFNLRLKRLFDERGIGFPFPQRVVQLIPEKLVPVTTERVDGEGGEQAEGGAAEGTEPAGSAEAGKEPRRHRGTEIDS